MSNRNVAKPRLKGLAHAMDVEKVPFEEREAMAHGKLLQAIKTSSVAWARRINNECHGYDAQSIKTVGSTFVLRIGDLRFDITVQSMGKDR